MSQVESHECDGRTGVEDSGRLNYAVQFRMALMKDGLWSIVDGSEACQDQATAADKYAKYVGRRDCALAIIILFVDPALLYLIGDPDDPAKVWKKLFDQLQKTWANKLALRHKLYSLRLREGGAVQEHVKKMTELFNELSGAKRGGEAVR